MNLDDKVGTVRNELLARYETLARKSDILKAPELKQLFSQIPTLQPHERASFGQAINTLSLELKAMVEADSGSATTLPPIDVTAPFDANAERPPLLPSDNGTIHPLSREIARLSDIFSRMGFQVETSREIDDQYHMFETLNFPEGHPARDDYDTFMTEEEGPDGHPYIAPAHTSTMQNRTLRKYKDNLKNDGVIAAVIPDRVFRNEDVDARHEHTFYQ
jgi:phenylalanyl-tRNA synthetase alpha chain